MEEVRIHSGTRVKLKHVDERALPGDFVLRLKEYAHKDERIQAVYFFAIEPQDQPEQPSIALAIRSGIFSKADEVFLQVVDEVQLMLPEDLSVNLYRFGASEFLASYCAQSLEPIYLRSAAWLTKQRKKYSKS